MSNIIVFPPDVNNRAEIPLPLSKSIVNRLLVIGYFANNVSKIQLSSSQDSVIMNDLITQLITKTKGETASQSISSKEITFSFNAGDAGTVFRFMTAVLAVVPGSWYLTGSERLKERPVAPLVDALRSIGAEIEYVDKEGYAPLAIKGKKLKGGRILINSGVSSQFISALMMISPMLSDGLEISIHGERVSWPYITLTANLMKDCGAKVEILEKDIFIKPASYSLSEDLTEADWSAASYWFSLVSISSLNSILLKGLKKVSYQGDSILTELYKNLGVKCEWSDEGLLLKHDNNEVKKFSVDLISNPDLAPALAVACAVRNVNAKLTGLQTLIIKESNRLLALQTELAKFGYRCDIINNNSLHIYASHEQIQYIKDKEGSLISLNTYNDHRIAMSLSLLSLKMGPLVIQDYEVVKKSYPEFWQHLHKAGFKLKPE